MFESASTEEDDTEDELPVSQKRSLPARSGPKKKAGLPKATESEIKDVRRRRSSSYAFGLANEVPRKADAVRRNYGLRNFLGSVSECR